MSCESFKAGQWVKTKYGRAIVIEQVNDEDVWLCDRKGNSGIMQAKCLELVPGCTGWEWEPEPKYRPFTSAAEASIYITKSPWVRQKSSGEQSHHEQIFAFNDRGAFIHIHSAVTTWGQLLIDFEWLDGTPCGVQV
jgi:hypothetical protein